MSLFVFMGRRREIVDMPEKMGGVPLQRSVKGALHLGPGTVTLTEDEQKFLEEHRKDVWSRLERRGVPKERKASPARTAAAKPQVKAAAEAEATKNQAAPAQDESHPASHDGTDSPSGGGRPRKSGRGRG
jgi:hypothetical protein